MAISWRALCRRSSIVCSSSVCLARRRFSRTAKLGAWTKIRRASGDLFADDHRPLDVDHKDHVQVPSSPELCDGFGEGPVVMIVDLRPFEDTGRGRAGLRTRPLTRSSNSPRWTSPGRGSRVVVEIDLAGRGFHRESPGAARRSCSCPTPRLPTGRSGVRGQRQAWGHRRSKSGLVLRVWSSRSGHSTFWISSRIFSRRPLISTTPRLISTSLAFEPIVLTSRPISWTTNSSFRPALSGSAITSTY